MRTAILGPAGCIRLPDGRSVSISVAGPGHGFPIVYCHGAIGSPRWHSPGLDSTLERHGIRYLVVDRPGFGRSDPQPDRTVVDWARDIGDVMTILGYDRFAVVGVSAGAPYALACGWALAERVTALAAVSPLGPPAGRGATRSLRYQAPLVPYGSPHVGPVAARLCLRTLGLHEQTSAAAMIDDYLVCRRHWGFELSDLHHPVTFWHGGRDRLIPLAHTLRLAAAVRHGTTLVDRHGGHFFYSRRIGAIISSLLPDASDVAMPRELGWAA
jgi:pimeloyl-ACP methyl ester carboxylesterase